MANKENISGLPPVGSHLRRERKRQELSLENLSRLSGVSAAMLSQIESGKVNPTIGTMWKIAQALQVNFEDLVTGERSTRRRFEVRKAQENALFSDNGVSFRVLSPISMSGELELYLVDMAPGAEHISQAHARETVEYLTVLAGRVEVAAGDEKVLLNAGDSIIYDVDTVHSLANRDDVPARLHMTVRFPAGSREQRS